jgi:hypothetical protein
VCGQVVLRPEEFSITQHLLIALNMHEEQLKLFERELTFLATFAERPHAQLLWRW